MKNTRLWLPVLIALLLFSAAAFYQITLPGLHHDEAQEAGLAGMQLKNGLPPTLFRNTGIVLAGRAFPLMVQDYIGALNVYLAWLSFGVGGVSVISLRTMTILMGLLTLVMAYGATRRLAGGRAAALMVLLLAIHPTFVFWMRQGVYVTSYTLTLALAALWLLLRWWGGGKNWNLLLAAFLMGVGLWGKLLFIWFMGGLFGAWLLVNLPHLLNWLRGQTTLRPQVQTAWWVVPLALLCCIGGLSPLIDYNLKSNGTFQSVFNNLDQSYYGVDNSNVSANFRERLRQTPVVFESGHMGELGGLYPNPIGREWFYLAIAGCLLGAWVERQRRGVRLFILLMVLLMVAQSSFTATALWYTHFALILPFMVILSAVGMIALLDCLKRLLPHRTAPGLMAGLLLLFMGYQGLSLSEYHQALGRTRGLATHSDAIYHLVAVLDQLPPHAPVAALDWGIGPTTEMLTEGRILPNEVFGYDWQPDPGFEGRMQPFFALDTSLYILHSDGNTVFPRREAFFELARAAGRTPVLEQVILDGQSNPYFEIWRME